MPFCVSCGASVTDSWQFCRACGVPLKIEADDNDLPLQAEAAPAPAHSIAETAPRTAAEAPPLFAPAPHRGESEEAKLVEVEHLTKPNGFVIGLQASRLFLWFGFLWVLLASGSWALVDKALAINLGIFGAIFVSLSSWIVSGLSHRSGATYLAARPLSIVGLVALFMLGGLRLFQLLGLLNAQNSSLPWYLTAILILEASSVWLMFASLYKAHEALNTPEIASFLGVQCPRCKKHKAFQSSNNPGVFECGECSHLWRSEP